MAPNWVVEAMNKYGGGGYGVRFILEKKITNNDVNDNNLLINRDHRDEFLAPALTRVEMVTALAPQGLQVTTYDMAGWKFYPILKCLGSSCSCVITGQEWMAIMSKNGFSVNDNLQLWSFRGLNTEELCFVVGRV